MTFGAADIRSGDVLLFHGKGFISWAIRKFDGTEVNHAAIALPDGMLAEAGGKGLQTRPIPNAVGSGEHILVRRYDRAPELRPVVTRAQGLLAEGHLYAYQQIVMLCVLSLTRRIPMPRLARRLVRAALDHAATAVLDLLPVGAQWMICSEYVFRSYEEAVPVGHFSLPIKGVSFAPETGEPSLLDWGLTEAASGREVPLSISPTFGGASRSADPVQRVAAIEAALAPFIADYANQLLAAGLTPESDLPPLLDVSFGPAPDLPPEPTDDELLASMATFGNALAMTQGAPPLIAPTFGAISAGTIGAAALAGALQGVRTLSPDADYVTPGDLLNCPALDAIGRIG